MLSRQVPDFIFHLGCEVTIAVMASTKDEDSSDMESDGENLLPNEPHSAEPMRSSSLSPICWGSIGINTAATVAIVSFSTPLT